MIRFIGFKDGSFDTKDENNEFTPDTHDVIVICNNYKLMDEFAKEVMETVKGNAEHNDYDFDDEDRNAIRLTLAFGLQRIIQVKDQTITLSLEPAIVYKASSPEEIWFLDEYGGTGDRPRLKTIYPMAVFKGYKDVWEQGKDEVYRYVVNGRYGAYDGKWVNITTSLS